MSFPAGTTFHLDDERVAKLLDQETVSEDEQAEVIGTLTFGGIEDKFTFFEVSLLPGDLIGEWRRELSVNQAMGSFNLLASLYQRRYPYEESERIAEPDSFAVPTVPRSGTEE